MPPKAARYLYPGKRVWQRMRPLRPPESTNFQTEAYYKDGGSTQKLTSVAQLLFVFTTIIQNRYIALL